MSEISQPENFKNTFQSIITTQPNTIQRKEIEILVGLIVDTDSRLYALASEYINGDVQTTLNSETMLYQSCTSPEFISDIWRCIRSALIEKLDIDIKDVELPDNYDTLNAVQKCQHVGHILEKLDTIYNNLYPGAVSFFSHTLQGLSGDLKDKVNSHMYTADRQHEYIESFAQRTQKSILFITADMQDFSRRFLSNRRMLPQMCHLGRDCKNMKDAYHRKWFVHPFGKTPFYFESLVLLPEKPSSANRSSPYGGSNSDRSKIKFKKTKYRRTHTKRRRRYTRRRRH